ncbi:putative inorganic phosphate cotransporter [Armadillidium vulgare]|nr:putative inorganic phosphate cotransporter [Armadillidium vulgare]
MPSIFKDLSHKIPSRVSISLLCALLVIELYITRTNLSIAIVSMVQTVTKEMIHSDVKREPFCLRNIYNVSENYTKYVTDNFTDEKTENTEVPPIQMTSTERGNILSAFYYAYGISGILGGRLAETFGTKKVGGVALLVDALVNFLIPFVSQSSYWLFFTLRECATLPSLSLGQWIPPDELTRAVGFVFHANNIGSSLTLMLCGYIISLLGWEYVFYISGSIASLCLVIWIFFFFDTPEKHPRISPQEKSYINEALKERKFRKKPDSVPIRKMLKSLPIWAATFAHGGSMCGLNLLVTQLPIYMSSIIGVNIRKNGILSALPFISRLIGSNASSWLLHFIKKKCHWKLKTLRLVATTIGPGVSYLLVGYVGCSQWSAILLFTLGSALNGLATSGYLCSYIDITSNFSGTALGISNVYASLNSMIVPVTIGALTPGENPLNHQLQK